MRLELIAPELYTEQHVQELASITALPVVPLPSPIAAKQAIRTSLTASTLDGVFATLFSNVTGGVLLSNFLVELHASPTEVGLLSSIPMLANLIQPLGAFLGDRTTSRHNYCLWVYGPSRLLWLILVAGIAFASWRGVDAQRLVWWTLAIVCLTHFIGALGSASWLSWLAALVPRRLRGRYFGLRNGAASLTNLLCVPLLGFAVSTFPGGSIRGFGAMLLLGIVAGLISLGFQFLMVDVNPQRQRGGEGSRESGVGSREDSGEGRGQKAEGRGQKAEVVTPHTSHLTPHFHEEAEGSGQKAEVVTPHTSHLTPHFHEEAEGSGQKAEVVTPHTSHLTPHFYEEAEGRGQKAEGVREAEEPLKTQNSKLKTQNSSPPLPRFLKDKNFLFFLLYFSAWMFAVNLSSPFFNLYMLDDLAIDVSWVTVYNSLQAGAMLIMLVIWGRLADRVGNRPLLIAVGLLVAITPLFWLGTGANSLSIWLWLPLLHILSGATWAAIDLCSNNLQLGVAPVQQQATYFAIAAAVAGISGALGTTVGGFLAEYRDYGGIPGLFALSAIVRLLALLPLILVHEQRGQSLRQMMRVLFPSKAEPISDESTLEPAMADVPPLTINTQLNDGDTLND